MINNNENDDRKMWTFDTNIACDYGLNSAVVYARLKVLQDFFDNIENKTNLAFIRNKAYRLYSMSELKELIGIISLDKILDAIKNLHRHGFIMAMWNEDYVLIRVFYKEKELANKKEIEESKEQNN